jgi:hypothetical protein
VRDHARPGVEAPIRRCLDRVRQLVFLAEERDLRQVPAGALHMDAVRLMTVHGAKGLEFTAVHVPGLNAASFPLGNRGQRCPPPVGMIRSAGGVAPKLHASAEHAAEEECLFFVAQSRARAHLRLYHATRQANGGKRSPSPFLDWLPAGSTEEVARPGVSPLPPDAPRPMPITVVRGGAWRLTEPQIRSYDACPRRFFYTHVLGLGAARSRTAFSRTHDCLHELMRWLSRKRGDERAPERVEAAFEEIWRRRGPVEHGLASDYRALASRLIATLLGADAGGDLLEPEPIEVALRNGSIAVLPDAVVAMPDGTVVIRRVRTGYRRSDEYDRLEYALHLLAARAGFATASVEALHLTDGASDRVAMSDRKLATRRDRADAMLADIAAGWYRPVVDAVSCPRCPHFFICASTPAGSLRLD